MSNFETFVWTIRGRFFLLSLSLLVIGAIYILILSIRQRSGWKLIVWNTVHAALISILDIILMDRIYLFDGTYKPLFSGELVLSMYALPWSLYVSAGIVSLVLLILTWNYIFRQSRRRITPVAIKEATDNLPVGICVSDSDGEVFLANRKMSELCHAITGGILNDAGRFWKELQKKSVRERSIPEMECLVSPGKGEIWQFRREELRLWGGKSSRRFEQISAWDVTELYHVTEELTAKNSRLRDVQFHMRAAAAREQSLIAAREIMNARMTVHNQMGNVLLTGKYYLDHPEEGNPEELLRLMRYSNYFFLMEAEQPDDMPDPCAQAIQLAGRIGVEVSVSGDLPEDEVTARDLIAEAIEQCAANTVRHAGGDRLEALIRREGSALCAIFTNNGRPPSRTVRETGGLADLRKRVEAAGGTMTIQSEPRFALELVLKMPGAMQEEDSKTLENSKHPDYWKETIKKE